MLSSVIVYTACERTDPVAEEFEEGSNSEMYGNWVRNNNSDTFVRFSGNTAITCANGQQTSGSLNASEPSMTFVIQGETIKFPLKFNGNTLLVGVPNQGVETHNSQIYNKTTEFCENSSGGENNGGNNNATTGNALFWIQKDHGCGNITVTINGQSRTISSYYSSGAPDCGASGSANFELPAGTYSFSASCATYQWNGSITINNGNCFKMRLD